MKRGRKRKLPVDFEPEEWVGQPSSNTDGDTTDGEHGNLADVLVPPENINGNIEEDDEEEEEAIILHPDDVVLDHDDIFEGPETQDEHLDLAHREELNPRRPMNPPQGLNHDLGQNPPLDEQYDVNHIPVDNDDPEENPEQDVDSELEEDPEYDDEDAEHINGMLLF